MVHSQLGKLSDLSLKEETAKPKTNSDDEAIRIKILEANQLIDRVKKALGKIKAIKPCENKALTKSSSTDIEETIKKLKKDAEELITGDVGDNLEKSTREPCSTCPSSSTSKQIEDPKESEDIDNVQCCDKYRDIGFERPKTRRSDLEDDLSEQLRKDKFRSSPESGGLEMTSSYEELQTKLQTISETTESNRSTPRKTYSCTDQLKMTCCNIDPIQWQDEEIQTKPELIDQGTCCSCPSADKSVQVGVSTKTVATETLAAKPKSLDTVNLPLENIMPDKRTCSCCQAEYLPVIEILPPPKKYICDRCSKVLKEEQIEGVSISCSNKRKAKLRKLAVQVLPPVIIRPAMTQRTLLNLSIEPDGRSENRIENTRNIVYLETNPAIASKMSFETLLPPKNDDEEDDIKDTDVEGFNVDEEDESQETLDKETQKNQQLEDTMKKLAADDNELRILRATHLECDKSKSGIHSELFPVKSNLKCPLLNRQLPIDQFDPFNENEENEIVLEEICHEDDFVCRSQRIPTRDLEDILIGSIKSEKLTPEQEEEMRKRIMWYKSYHIYDNPNKHDPGPLDKKSMDKISQIDFQFYKTFINPDPTISREIFSPRTSSSQILGFESKMIQCDQSMLMAAQEAGFNKHDPVKKLNFMENIKEPKIDSGVIKDNESEVTLLQVKVDEAEAEKQHLINAMQSTLVMRGSYEESESTPSEITVTVSYSMSEEENLDDSRLSNKSISEFHETEVKSINLEEPSQDNPELELPNKFLKVKDKEVINKLQEKLKSVDTDSSIPTFPVINKENDETLSHFLKSLAAFDELKQSIRNSQGSKRNSDNQDKNPTLNYVFNNSPSSGDVCPTHLELGRNGRYKDEEDLFFQFPPATMNKKKFLPRGNSLEYRDKEVGTNRFEVIPRRRLRRYSPDTSNSDTVTTNSISEGEILCKHSVSNGEIHACRQNLNRPRNVFTRKHLLTSHVPKKFDLNDPTVTIEQRRNYFNNWVTYYVKPQEVHESTTSSCSNNK